MLYDFLNRQIPDFLPKLRAQNPRLYEGGDSNAQAVARGGSVGLDVGRSIRRRAVATGRRADQLGDAQSWHFRTDVSRLVHLEQAAERSAAVRRLGDVARRPGGVAWLRQYQRKPRFDDIPKSISRAGMVMVDNTEYTPEAIRKIREEFLKYFRK